MLNDGATGTPLSRLITSGRLSDKHPLLAALLRLLLRRFRLALHPDLVLLLRASSKAMTVRHLAAA